MVSTEPPMSWLPVKEFWFSVTEMSEKDVANQWSDLEPESTLLKLIQSVPFKPVCKVMKLSELRTLLEKSIFSSLLLEIKTSSRLNIWLRWKTTPLLETLDISITKSNMKSLENGQESRELTLNHKLISSLLKPEIQSSFLPKVNFLFYFRTFVKFGLCNWSPIIRYVNFIQQPNIGPTRTLGKRHHQQIY